MASQRWSRTELILAFNLYCKTPFGKIHNKNPEIITLAKAIGRTPSAVSWKLANFSRLDPALKARDIKGASHGGKEELVIWEEFHSDWGKLALESELLLRDILPEPTPEEVVDTFPEGVSKKAWVHIRINQAFFRKSVLASYDYKCCITGLDNPSLLNASHIIPWRVDVKNRTNPRNGLCLNALHDRAFDCGLLTITPEYRVRLAKTLTVSARTDELKSFFLRYEDAPIRMPNRFAADQDFLRYHNAHVFRGK